MNHRLTLIWFIGLVSILLVKAMYGQPMAPVAPALNTNPKVITVSNAPIWHNPRLLQMDGYTNLWLEVQSCTNLKEGKWTAKQVYYLPTNFPVDMTNREEYFKVEVKMRVMTNK